MKHPNRLADLTITDLLRLHRIQERLNTLDDAIAATSLQAKPAIRKLLSESYFEAEDIFAKGARVFAKHVQAGWVPGIGLDQQFWNHVTAVMQASAQPAEVASEGAPAAVAQGEVAPAGEPESTAAAVGSADPL